jgi:hypothetical protein
MVKTTAAMLVATAAMLWTAGAAFAGQSAFGTGGGWSGFAPGERIAHFSFSAHEADNGDFGQVHWSFEYSDLPDLVLDLTVDVDCVNITPSLFGGNAWIDGVATSVSPQPNYAGVMPGDRLAFQARDGGSPSATGMVDEFDAFAENDAQEIGVPDCKARPPLPLSPNVTQGNVVIKGA